jgi:Mg2+/Co2+ transporter CorB
MLAIEVSLNGKVLAVAGRENLSSLSASFTAFDGVTTVSEEIRKELDIELPEYPSLHVSGMVLKSTPKNSSPDSKDFIEIADHVIWLNEQKINVGDQITLRLIDTKDVTPPEKN